MTLSSLTYSNKVNNTGDVKGVKEYVIYKIIHQHDNVTKKESLSKGKEGSVFKNKGQLRDNDGSADDECLDNCNVIFKKVQNGKC